MRIKHALIAHIETSAYSADIGSRSVVVTPKTPQHFGKYWPLRISGIETVPSDKDQDALLGGHSIRLAIIPDQALRMQYIVEAARLRRMPEKSRWATRAYSFASVEVMLLELLDKGCGRLAVEVAKYRHGDGPDPMDAIVLRVNHEATRAPALEMNFFGFWVELFKSKTLALPRTTRKVKPAWTWQTGEVKFSELLPSHQVKAMEAIKRFM